MVSRRRRRRTGLLGVALILVGACSAGTSETTTSQPTTSTSSSTTTTASITTPTSGPTTTSSVPVESPGEVMVPDGPGPFPAVVLAHGGSWLFGSPSDMRPLASYLTESGFLTVNARYKLSAQSPGFPQAVDDLACAVRYAASHPESDGTVAIIGFSAGGHISALVALTGDRYGQDCPYPGTGLPDRFVGLAAVYDVRPLESLLAVFFGQSLIDAPDLWGSGNPQQLVEANPLISAFILHGEADRLINVNFATAFYEGLPDGNGSALEVIAGADHSAMARPNVVGPLIVEWLNGN